MSEKINFQAEVGKLLDIVINSIYSERQIFLRELISNASDACDKLRYLCLTNPDIAKSSTEMKIKIIPNIACTVKRSLTNTQPNTIAATKSKHSTLSTFALIPIA